MEVWARLQIRTGKSKTYLYYFSRVPPGRRSQALGAYHSAEILYLFDNLGLSNRPWEDTDRKLVGVMSS
jgi:para-nitrobenzyl esterase